VRVLVDTSVWSLLFRRAGPAEDPSVRQLTALLDAEEDVVLIGVILQEILQAFRSPAVAQRVEARLRALPLLELERRNFVDAAALKRRCASKGITASTVDCQIAQAAIAHSCILLTADRDFLGIASQSALRLA
jgi:hypothetical protein